MPPLPTDSIHARACKLKCEKILTRPTLGGVTFFMVHNRKEVPADLAGVDAVVFGHSHKYVQEEKGGVLWLNPGSCGPRRFHQEITMMTAEAEDGKIRVEKVIIPHGTA